MTRLMSVLYVYPNNSRTSWKIIMKLGMNIMPCEVTTSVFFLIFCDE
jgi:hypothetical protein